MAVDSKRMDEFTGRFVNDLGAAVHAGMVVIGEKLGLYKALAAYPMTSAELSAKTATDERYVREWLASQAAGGYVTYVAVSSHPLCLGCGVAFVARERANVGLLLVHPQSGRQGFHTVSASSRNGWWNFVRRQADTESLAGKMSAAALRLSTTRVCQTGSVYRKFSTRRMSLLDESNCV